MISRRDNMIILATAGEVLADIGYVVLGLVVGGIAHL